MTLAGLQRYQDSQGTALQPILNDIAVHTSR